MHLITIKSKQGNIKKQHKLFLAAIFFYALFSYHITFHSLSEEVLSYYLLFVLGSIIASTATFLHYCIAKKTLIDNRSSTYLLLIISLLLYSLSSFFLDVTNPVAINIIFCVIVNLMLILSEIKNKKNVMKNK